MRFGLEPASVRVFAYVGVAVVSWIAIGVVYALVAYAVSIRRRPTMPGRVGAELLLVLLIAVMLWPFFVFEVLLRLFERPKRNQDGGP